MAPLFGAADVAALGCGGAEGAGARDAVRIGLGGAGTGGVETMLGALGGALAFVVVGACVVAGAVVAAAAALRVAGWGFRASGCGLAVAIIGGLGATAGVRVARVGRVGRAAAFVTGALGLATLGAAMRGRVGLMIGRGAGRVEPISRDPMRERSPLNGSRPFCGRA